MVVLNELPHFKQIHPLFQSINLQIVQTMTFPGKPIKAKHLSIFCQNTINTFTFDVIMFQVFISLCIYCFKIIHKSLPTWLFADNEYLSASVSFYSPYCSSINGQMKDIAVRNVNQNSGHRLKFFPGRAKGAECVPKIKRSASALF